MWIIFIKNYLGEIRFFSKSSENDKRSFTLYFVYCFMKTFK